MPGAAGRACWPAAQHHDCVHAAGEDDQTWLDADVPCMRTGQAAAGIRPFGDKVLKKERQLCCFCATYLQEEL